MIGCKMRNWWILKYSCPKHNLKNNILQVVVEQMPNNEVEMVEINLQNNNDIDQESTIPIDVINPPSHPQNNTSDTSENGQVQDETSEDSMRDVPTLIRTNKNGRFKKQKLAYNCLIKFLPIYFVFSALIFICICVCICSVMYQSRIISKLFMYTNYLTYYTIFLMYSIILPGTYFLVYRKNFVDSWREFMNYFYNYQ